MIRCLVFFMPGGVLEYLYTLRDHMDFVLCCLVGLVWLGFSAWAFLCFFSFFLFFPLLARWACLVKVVQRGFCSLSLVGLFSLSFLFLFVWALPMWLGFSFYFSSSFLSSLLHGEALPLQLSFPFFFYSPFGLFWPSSFSSSRYPVRPPLLIFNLYYYII